MSIAHGVMVGFFSVVLILLGTVLFSFAFWRRLKEDYGSDEIFKATTMLLVGGLVGWLIVDRWFGEFAFWGFALGFLISVVYITLRLTFKPFEIIDSVAWAFFWLWVFVELRFLLIHGLGQWVNIFLVVAPVLSLISYKFLTSRYRRFSWYPSGRIGFLGFSSFAIYFFLHSAVAFGLFWMLSFRVYLFDGLLSFFLVWLFVLGIYLRSGRARAERVGVTLKRIRRGWGFK